MMDSERKHRSLSSKVTGYVYLNAFFHMINTHSACMYKVYTEHFHCGVQIGTSSALCWLKQAIAAICGDSLF
jgi:hypothetical protein